LFLVLAGGTAFATTNYLAAGKHHRKHYVLKATKQIKPSVLAALKGDTGPTGPTGPTGGAGPAGPANPSAATLDGQTLTKFFFKAPENTGSTEVFSGDGLTLDATCSATGQPGLSATSTDPDAEINASGDNFGAFAHIEWAGFSSPPNLILNPSSSNEGSMIVTYANTSHQVVTITLGYDDSNSFNSFVGCGVWGTATQS
jgi:hypothetical protein